MEIVIRVQKLGCGRVVAKVEPVGPVVEAQDAETAIQFAKTAHRSYLKTQREWLVSDAWDLEPVYRVDG